MVWIYKGDTCTASGRIGEVREMRFLTTQGTQDGIPTLYSALRMSRRLERISHGANWISYREMGL